MSRESQRPEPPTLPPELLAWLADDAVRGADISEEHLTYSDLDPRLESDQGYRCWADSVAGAIVVGEDLVDLQDSASVLALQLRLRLWAELGDRRYFATTLTRRRALGRATPVRAGSSPTSGSITTITPSSPPCA